MKPMNWKNAGETNKSMSLKKFLNSMSSQNKPKIINILVMKLMRMLTNLYKNFNTSMKSRNKFINQMRLLHSLQGIDKKICGYIMHTRIAAKINKLPPPTQCIRQNSESRAQVQITNKIRCNLQQEKQIMAKSNKWTTTQNQGNRANIQVTNPPKETIKRRSWPKQNNYARTHYQNESLIR